jgi:hypothetical protein
VRRGTIAQVTSRTPAAQQLHDLARLRRVRDRIDREYCAFRDPGGNLIRIQERR